jgi:hypothetical protein
VGGDPVLGKIPFGDPDFVKALERLLLEKGIGGEMVEEGIQSLTEAGPEVLREILGAMGGEKGGEMAVGEFGTGDVDTQPAMYDGYADFENQFLDLGEVRPECQGQSSEEGTLESGSTDISTRSTPPSIPVSHPTLVTTVPLIPSLGPVPTVAVPPTVVPSQAPTLGYEDRVRAYGFPPMLRLQ